MTFAQVRTVLTVVWLALFASYMLSADSPVADGPPVLGEGLHALIVYDLEARNPPAEIADIAESVSLVTWLNSHGFEWRRWDDETKVVDDSEWFKAALEVPRESLPWLVASNGMQGYSGPVSSVDDVKAQLEALK